MTITELPGSASLVSADLPVPAGEEDTRLAPGTRVEVRRRLDAKWARGFEVLDNDGGLYRLRRLSDGAALPVPFPHDDVRLERRNRTWWF